MSARSTPRQWSFCPPARATNMYSTFSSYEFRSISCTWETIFETLVCCLPGVDLTEINSFLVSPPLFSQTLDFVSCEWMNLVCVGTLVAWEQLGFSSWLQLVYRDCFLVYTHIKICQIISFRYGPFVESHLYLNKDAKFFCLFVFSMKMILVIS